MVQQELERYRNDALYFEEHRQDFLERYPERWVAVYNREVAGTASRLAQLLRHLEKEGFPRGDVFIEHISAKEDLLILTTL